MCINARAHACTKHRTHRHRSAPNIHVHTRTTQYTGRCTSAHSTRTHVLAHTQLHGVVLKRAHTHKHFDTHLSALAFSQSYWGPAAAMVTALVAKTILNLSYPNLYSHTRLLSVNHINMRGVCAGLLPAVCHKKLLYKAEKRHASGFLLSTEIRAVRHSPAASLLSGIHQIICCGLSVWSLKKISY